MGTAAKLDFLLWVNFAQPVPRVELFPINFNELLNVEIPIEVRYMSRSNAYIAVRADASSLLDKFLSATLANSVAAFQKHGVIRRNVVGFEAARTGKQALDGLLLLPYL